MTPFELGYAAFLKGLKQLDNSFNKDTCPHSYKRWLTGWARAASDHSK